MEVYSEIHSVVSVVRIICHTKFVSQIGPAVFCVKPEYMRVCLAYVCVERRHETKMDTNLGKKTHRAEKIATILGKKPHIYRVIILKQMADQGETLVSMLCKQEQIHILVHAYFERIF